VTYLPPDIDPDDEISLTWERDDEGVRIVASLGETSITVESSYDGAAVTPWLVAALPNVLEHAWAAIEAEMEEA